MGAGKFGDILCFKEVIVSIGSNHEFSVTFPNVDLFLNAFYHFKNYVSKYGCQELHRINYFEVLI